MITLEDAIKMLEARLDCMHRSSSGIDVDCNREKCDDCDLNYAQGTVGEQQEALKEAISALEKQMPTIEPEQKRGKWIYDGDCYICNQCKSAFGWWAYSQTSNYCPNCGAKMEEEQ